MNLPKNFLSPFTLAGCEPQAVLCALSGGADSVSLLDMLCRLSRELHFKVYAAHVNHNIRTEQYNNEALRDEIFCRQLCSERGIELFVLGVDIPALASKSGESVETAARSARYGFFGKIMREHNIKILLTAHNANDSLETQLFNLCRGCGTLGVAGIPPMRPFSEGDGMIVRPILRMTKREILDYCKENGLNFVTDSTNGCDDYTRNRIRHKIIPELEDMFENPLRSAQRLALCARADADFISSEADRIISNYPEGKIPLGEFNPLHPALKSRIICSVFGGLSNASLEFVHINALIELCEKSVPHSKISLPERKCGEISGGYLVFCAETTTAPTSYGIPLSVGFNAIDGCDFSVVISEGTPEKTLNFGGEIYTLYTFAHIKNATIVSLFARPKADGDTIRSGGMTKKVKKLFCEKKIPADERASLPLIFENDELIYVPRCAVADRVISRDRSGMGIYIYKHSED